MLDTIATVDLLLLKWLTPWHAPWLDACMAGLTAIGRGGLVWLVLAGVAFASPRSRATAWRTVLAIGLAFLLVDGVVKPIIQRARPAVMAQDGAAASNRDLPPLPSTFSFPSGHATSSAAAATAISRIWPGARVVWWLLAAAIAYSRVYLGHHYPFDVLGGMALGIAVALWVLGGRHPATYPTRSDLRHV